MGFMGFINVVLPVMLIICSAHAASLGRAVNENETATIIQDDAALIDAKHELPAGNPPKLWPNGRIPFVISDGFSYQQLALLRIAINEYNNQTCLRFVPKTDDDADFVNFWKQSGPGHCTAAVGKQGGEQKIILPATCFSQFGLLLHQMMHAAGFFDEHMRIDRDKYIKIDFNNLQQKNWHYFNKIPEATDMGLPYDFNSIMHGDNHTFSVDPKTPVVMPVRTLPMNVLDSMGQRLYFSPTDLVKLNTAYNCSMGKDQPEAK